MRRDLRCRTVFAAIQKREHDGFLRVVRRGRHRHRAQGYPEAQANLAELGGLQPGIPACRVHALDAAAPLFDQPTGFELAVNFKTAKQRNVTIPYIVMLRATDVIE